MKDQEGFMNMQQYRPFLLALYLVGALFIVGSLSEPIFQIWPLRLGEVSWRFGAAGLMAGGMIGLVFGLTWLMGVAAVLEHRRVLRGLAVVNLVMAVVLTGACVLFALDFLQVRSTVNPQLRGSLDLTVLRAMLILGATIPTTLALGIGGWRISRPSRQSSRAEQQASLVYRT
jgi:hypothetical protein